MKPVRILLAEDNQATGKMYHDYLTAKGMEVDLAIDGSQALALAHTGGYSLILLDIHMPKLSGIEVLGQLKKQPPLTPNGPIVMLTNLSDEHLVQQAISLGAMSYVDKSNLAPNSLANRIYQALGLPHQN